MPKERYSIPPRIGGGGTLVERECSPTLHAGHGVRLNRRSRKWERLRIRATGRKKTILGSGTGSITLRMERRLLEAARAM